MTDTARSGFLEFLEAGIDRGGFETDDALAALLPLLKQVLSTHEAGLVAPLRGIGDLHVSEEGYLVFDPEKAVAPSRNKSKIEELRAPVSHALEVVAGSRRTADVNDGTLTVADLALGASGDDLIRPVFLPSHESWEHLVGHHDDLTDIFSLGMLLASVSCGLDFTNPNELEVFVAGRSNLFEINGRINPVIASAIVQMTELSRHKRVDDLAALISRLENYHDQPADLDFNRLPGFTKAGVSGKRRLIQSRLRDRLFEISRRNRLIYFKPTLQTLNLTVASMPLLLNYRTIKLEQLFVWQPELAGAITAGGPMSLGKYLRFEDAPYIAGSLEKLISESRRDRAEFGFAQLRLVLCFLRWNNLKESPSERIHSPLLLLPVELTKKRGVRDQYILDPSTSEAEVNPALRHHLKELYNLDLPELVDLRATTMDQFHDSLRAQIQETEPGVSLNKIDRPQIELIHERARQQLAQYRRRLRIKARAGRGAAKPEYSYDHENFHPLGLQLFLDKVRPSPMPMRDVSGAPPRARLPHIVETEHPREPAKFVEKERRMYALRDGYNQNPYAWDFDLCSQTLGNFHYRKMTLVRDYTKLIETDMASRAFDTIFSLSPRIPETTSPPPLTLADQHLIISCDATQATAVARARTGLSYIIQGPPGTGKSQTITNLIADYAARGKRVLFVCEKRTAIDVVFHRLRQQRLDELCCLIHDSQTDKKAFIQDLKQTYEKFLSQDELDADADQSRAKALNAIEQDLASLRGFSESMQRVHEKSGVPFRSLLHRLVEICGRAQVRPPEVEDSLPDYVFWLRHGESINRLRAALEDLGEDLCFARHPFRWLGKGVLEADRPLEALATQVKQAEQSLEAVKSALELSGLPDERADKFDQIDAVLEFASRAEPMAHAKLLGVLTKGPAAKQFDKLAAKVAETILAQLEAREKASPWKVPLSPDDTPIALQQALAFEHSLFSFLRPDFWRLRKSLRARYDFARHAVAPSMVKILTELSAWHELQAAESRLRAEASKKWQTEDIEAICKLVFELRNDRLLTQPSVTALIGQLSKSDQAGPILENLAAIREPFMQLDQTLHFLLAEHQQFNLPELAEVLARLREQTGELIELLPVLRELTNLPDPLSYGLRHAPVPLDEFESAIGQKSVNVVYREDRAVLRFEGRTLAHRMEFLEKHHREWLGLNSRCIRAAVRRRFLEHVNTASLSATQLDSEEKAFKKTFSAGRRELEHEFGKTMRYKSIRDLAANATGDVIKDLKPIWLMSPLSVSDTLPLDPGLFDVVIFDEASQIPLEEAVPAIYRSHQVIVVGDEMQLPPTTFFSSGRDDEQDLVVEEDGERIAFDLGSDSFLAQSAKSLPSTLLAWHYRSRYESLISFSNAAFYSGELFTIPDRQRFTGLQGEIHVTADEEASANVDALLARSVSFHFMENGLYQDRRNHSEAAYIARLIRGLLDLQTGLSIGVVAFSEAQQTAIEDALNGLAEEDSAFAAKLEAAYLREEDDQFCGLFVKNLENVQGDERDIILMSVCYGPDSSRRILMNFGPINQRGGEKRLNVIFSRAKHHMAVISSMHHGDITNDHNVGANCLKNFLKFAEATSKGDDAQARRVLESSNPLNRKALAPEGSGDAVVTSLAKALEERGYTVDLDVGQSRFRCDLAVRSSSDRFYQLGILVDTSAHYRNPNLLDRYLMQPSILRAFGWRFALVLTKDWYHNPDDVLARIERLLEEQPPEAES